MIAKKLLENIYRGKEGLNKGISTGLPTVDTIIHGIRQESITVIGADTSGGKTSYALDINVYNLLKNKGDKEVKILYYSFEMSSEMLFAKLLSRYIFDEFGFIITYEEILSLNEKITDKQLEYVNKSIQWLKYLESHLTIYDKALTPAGIYATSRKWLEQNGVFEQVGEHREEYHPNNPETLLIGIVDHLGLIGGTGSKKEKMDLVSEYQIYFRNKCKMAWLNIQQMNRNAKSMDRKTNGYELYQLDDFMYSSEPVQAADVVLALYFPYREKIARCEGYPIQNVLKRRFRLLQVLKNRFGLADVNKALLFFGEIGMFKELPRPDEIGDYEPYITLENHIPNTAILENMSVEETDDNVTKNYLTL